MAKHPPSSSPLQAGAAQVDITPNPGIPLSGYIAREGVSTGIHDRLAATVLALSGAGHRAALVSCDLVGLDQATVSTIRQKIQSATGIPARDVMVACTHTHSGPATIFLQDCGEVDTTYMRILERKLAAAAEQAVKNLRPVQVKTGKAVLHGWAVDRRSPGAEIDEEVGVVGLYDEQGQPAAVLVNYACHPVVLGAENRLISADYPGYLKQALQDSLGCPAIFLTGAAGNVDPIQRGNYQAAQAFGQALADCALRLLAETPSATPTHFSIGAATLELPLLPLPSEVDLTQTINVHRQKAAESARNGKTIEAKIHNAMLHWAEATLAKVQAGRAEASLAGEAQVLHLDRAAVVGVSGELFSSLGQAIKKGGLEMISHERGDGIILINGYTNSVIGYIPPRQEYARGGYEIAEAHRYYGYPAALAAEAGERIVETALRLLSQRA